MFAPHHLADGASRNQGVNGCRLRCRCPRRKRVGACNAVGLLRSSVCLRTTIRSRGLALWRLRALACRHAYRRDHPLLAAPLHNREPCGPPLRRQSPLKPIAAWIGRRRSAMRTGSCLQSGIGRSRVCPTIHPALLAVFSSPCCCARRSGLAFSSSSCGDEDALEDGHCPAIQHLDSSSWSAVCRYG